MFGRGPLKHFSKTFAKNICTEIAINANFHFSYYKSLRLIGPLDSRDELYIPAPQEVKEAAYKGLMHPILEYGNSVLDPPGVVLQEDLESVQKRTARFVTGNYKYETGSMTGILGQLKWE